MGAAQSVPGLGETVTAIDSGVKLVAAGSCAVVGEILHDEDAKDAAKKFAKDAGNSWVEYSERNVIAAPVRAIVHVVADDNEEAERVLKKMGKSVEQVVDNTPALGHVKGIGHYIAGDTKHGDDCMKGASRTLAVVGAGALTGGVGGGVVLGGLAGASSGVAYDGMVTAIESSVKGKDCPYGTFASINQVIEAGKQDDGHGVINAFIDTGYSLSGDFFAGAAAAKTAETLNEASKQRRALKEEIGREGAEDVIDTAKRLEKLTEDVQGDNHVCTKAKNLGTGDTAYGTNKRLRQQMRMKEFNSRGKASGYASRTNARKGRVGEFPREAGILERTADDMHMDYKPRVGTRAPRACAEHQAFNDLGTHGARSNIRTASVTSRNGKITAIKRCHNCMQFGELMGDVTTDRIHGMAVPTKQFVLDKSLAAAKSAAPYTIAAVAVCADWDEDTDDSESD